MYKRAALEAAIASGTRRGGESDEMARRQARILIDLQIQAGQCKQVGADIVLTDSGTEQVQTRRKIAQG